jgi:hypothetical protein
LVDFFDGDALAGQVCELLQDALVSRRLGGQARAFAQLNYDLHAACLPRQLAWVESLAAAPA